MENKTSYMNIAECYPKLKAAGILPAYDSPEKRINQYIYDGKLPENHTQEEERAYKTRMKRLYDQHMELEHHMPGNPEVCRLLINDALDTGQWKDLPDCLQGKYHEKFSEKLRNFITDAQEAEEDFDIARDLRAAYYCCHGLNIIKVLQDALQDTVSGMKGLEQHTIQSLSQHIADGFYSDIELSSHELEYDIETIDMAVDHYDGLFLKQDESQKQKGNQKAKDSYKSGILQTHLDKMKTDAYYLTKVRGDTGNAINLDEGALKLLKAYYDGHITDRQIEVLSAEK